MSAPAGPPDVGALAPALFRFRHPVEVRFRDLDPMGHVHHSVALIYFEEARAAYWRDVAGQTGTESIGYVIGELAVRYHARIHFPQRLELLARVGRMSGKSWSMQYQLHAAGELLVSGETTQVMYDYQAEKAVPIPDDIRERIARFENA